MVFIINYLSKIRAGGLRGIRQVYLSEVSNSALPRVLVQADGKMNEAVGTKNCLILYGGKKWQVCPFRRQELWKYIGCILLAVTYGKKGHNIWSEKPKTFGKNLQTKLHKDVRGNTDLNKVCCDLCCPYYCYTCH